MKLPLLCLLALPFLPQSVWAAETWLQPDPFVAVVGDAVTVKLRLTDGKTTRDANLKPDRILRFELVQGEKHTPLPLTSDDVTQSSVAMVEGTSVVVMETEPKHVDLPADKFAAYLREQGLTQVQAERRKRGEMQKTAREDFMRCMKTLLTTDARKAPDDRPQGCPYELVLRRQVSRTLTFETLRHGDPEPYQQVRIWNLDTGKVWKVARTDKTGRLSLPVPPGRWLATSTAMRRSSELQSDWRSDWASLTWQHWAKR